MSDNEKEIKNNDNNNIINENKNEEKNNNYNYDTNNENNLKEHKPNSVNLKIISISLENEKDLDYKIVLYNNENEIEFENFKLKKEDLNLIKKIENIQNEMTLKLFEIENDNKNLLGSSIIKIDDFKEDSFSELIIKNEEDKEITNINYRIEFLDFKESVISVKEEIITKPKIEQKLEADILRYRDTVNKLFTQNNILEKNIEYIEEKMKETFDKLKEKRKIKPKLTEEEEAIYKEIKDSTVKIKGIQREILIFKNQVSSNATFDKISSLKNKKGINDKEYSRISSENKYLVQSLTKIEEDIKKFEDDDHIKKGLEQLLKSSNENKTEIKEYSDKINNKEKGFSLLITIYIEIEKLYRDLCLKYSINDNLNLKIVDKVMNDFKELKGNPKERKVKEKIENKIKNPIVKAIRKEQDKMEKFKFEELTSSKENYTTLINEWKDLNEKIKNIKKSNVTIKENKIEIEKIYNEILLDLKKKENLARVLEKKEIEITKLKKKIDEAKIKKDKEKEKIEEKENWSAIYDKDENIEIEKIIISELKDNILGKKYNKKFEEIKKINLKNNNKLIIYYDDNYITGFQNINFDSNSKEIREQLIGKESSNFKEIELELINSITVIYSKGISSIIFDLKNEKQEILGSKLVNINSKKVKFDFDIENIDLLELGLTKKTNKISFISFLYSKEGLKNNDIEKEKKENIENKENRENIENRENRENIENKEKLDNIF